MATTTAHGHEHARPRSSALWLIILLLIIVAIGAWVWYATRPQPARVVRRDIVGALNLPGAIIVPPSAHADVYAPFRAPVDKLEASVGQYVERGAVLARLAYPAGQSAEQQALANVKAAETAYANARSQYDASVQSAKKQLDAARATGQPPVTAPDASGQPAPSPNPPVDNGPQIASAQAALQQAQADRDAALLPYKQQLDAAREAYQQAKSGARIANIKTPIGGTVLALNATPGQEVGVDNKTPFATIVDLSQLQVQAELTPEQSGMARVDTPVTLTFAEIPGKQFEGRIKQLTTRVDTKAAGLIKDQKYVAVIDFKNTEAQVKPGMKPMVAIKLGEAKNALAVPSEAIDTDQSGRPIVKVLRGGQWQPAPVQVGVSDGQFTEVKQGVSEGETVQVTPNLLHAGSR